MESPQKSVELFHLLFLSHLSAKLEKGLYAVKGGCNLRFFFKSIRYSEDLDIDVKTISKETLRNKIDRLLKSPAFLQNLAVRNLAIVQISEAKQTETTQRWKVSLQLADSSIPLPTKIEFSRRELSEACLFEPIDSEVLQRHELYPILINHYIQEAALCQKIDALIHRTEVQARDVFDIHLLLSRGASLRSLPEPFRRHLDTAIDNAFSITFSDFYSQVVAYLMSEYQDYYSSPEVWNDLQTKVALRLEEAKNP